MKAAPAQVGMAGAADRDLGLVAGDHRLDQRRAAAGTRMAGRQQHRHHHAAGMHGTLPVAVVHLDAVRGGAAEERGIEEIGAPRAARHRNAAGRPHRGEHRLGAGRDLAAGAGDHDADGVEQVAPGVMADLVGEGRVAQPADKADDGLGRSGGRMAASAGPRRGTSGSPRGS